MSTGIKQATRSATGIAVAVFGLSLSVVPGARAATLGACRSGQAVKNLVAPGTPLCAVRAVVPQPLTRREVKKLAATAESRGDYLRLAGYYNAEAERMDGEAAKYEEAAAAYRNGPRVKNLAAPNTSARYQYFAKGSRDQAKSDRERAASYELEASDALATAN